MFSLTWSITGPVDTVVLHHAVADTVTLQYWTGIAWATPPDLDAEEYDDPLFSGYTTHWIAFTALTGSGQLRLTLTQTGSSTISASNLLTSPAVPYSSPRTPVSTDAHSKRITGNTSSR